MPTGYTGLGAFGDFVGGFTNRSDELRKENAAEQDKKDARANQIFTLMANSDDPDIRAAAVTGLLSGDHPATGMDKWFGKVQGHPMYDTISGLVNTGHKPFMDPVDRTGAEASSSLRQRIGVVKDEKTGLTPEQQSRAVQGMVGAPPPRVAAAQYGTLVLQDGTTIAGSFDPSDQTFTDAEGTQRADVKEFRRNSGSQGASGHGTKVVPDKTSSTGFRYVRYDDSMKELGRGGEAPAPGGGSESFTGIQTPTGIMAFGNKSGSVRPAKGGEGVTAPAPPATNVNSLRENEASILRLHPQPKPLFAGGKVNPDKMVTWRNEVDAEAQKYGYSSYEELQRAIGTATQDVGNRVAQPPPDPATAAPAAGGAGAPPPAAPAQKPGQPRRPAAAAPKKSGAVDVKAVLAELAKNRAKVASTIPQPGAPPAPAR